MIPKQMSSWGVASVCQPLLRRDSRAKFDQLAFCCENLMIRLQMTGVESDLKMGLTLWREGQTHFQVRVFRPEE